MSRCVVSEPAGAAVRPPVDGAARAPRGAADDCIGASTIAKYGVLGRFDVEDDPAGGSALYDAVVSQDTSRLTDGGWLDRVEAISRLEARLAGLKAEAVAGFDDALRGVSADLGHRHPEPADRAATAGERRWHAGDLRSIADELGLALHLHRGAATRRIHASCELVHNFPATWHALVEGDLTERAAFTIVAELSVLDDLDDLRAAEAEVLAWARKHPLQGIKQAAQIIVARRSPAATDKAHRRALDERSVRMHPGDLGTAALVHTQDALDAAAVMTSLSRAAARRRRKGDPRTLDQLRADIALARLLPRTKQPTAPSPDPATDRADAADAPRHGPGDGGDPDHTHDRGSTGAGAAPAGGYSSADREGNSWADRGASASTDRDGKASADHGGSASMDWDGSSPADRGGRSSADRDVNKSADRDGSTSTGRGGNTSADRDGSVSGAAENPLNGDDADELGDAAHGADATVVIHATGAELRALINGQPGTGGEAEHHGPIPQNSLRKHLLKALTDTLLPNPAATTGSAAGAGAGAGPTTRRGGSRLDIRVTDQPPPSDPDRYTPSAALDRYVRLRDRTCRFPGCNRPAEFTDLDHRIAFAAGGRTTADNLHCLCRHHHRLKHEGGWKIHQHPDGTHTWISPTGRRYRDNSPPAYRLPPIRTPGST